MNLIGTITAGAGAAKNSKQQTRASLNLATKTTHVDTVIEAALEVGYFGNAYTIAFVGDSAAGRGISITVDIIARTVVVHYEAGVSTVALLEAAIAALVGPQAVIRVKTAGTAANILAAGTDAFAATALAGGVGFNIGPGARNLYLQSDTAGVQFELGQGDAFQSTAARGAFIPADSLMQGPFPTNGTQPVLSIWNPTGGQAVVNVYAE